ncbi:COP9 signalosome [Dunaliella salina]|uniref:COP9 signalosome complex subunit 8 n=1 Tax=Dunaliella salina TaxID=3046 RepID=A0ABQ7GM79_DUNSA|nr:COP9 signalosome [Dunaliella salina]|eukprot:KAF5835714.1 COP9 signalosome [Dunaliella salina]
MGTIQERLQEHLQHRAFEEIAPLLDSAELESPNPLVLQDNWPFVLHLLGHIYNKQLPDARMLWKRIPQNVKENNAELSAVWRLLQFFWQRQYVGVWQALQSYQWSPQSRPLVDALSLKTREELIDLIGTAYSTVKPSKVASLCGMPQQEALAACQKLGWQYNEGAGTLSVVRKPVSAEHEGVNNLQNLAEYMSHIEH